MSLTNTSETNLLRLIFQNITWAGVGDTTGIVGSTTPGSLHASLHTADPGETGDQTTSETGYTNYTRTPVARSTGGWTVSGTTQVANAAAINFPQCGVVGAVVTYFGIGKSSSGAGELIVSGALDNSLTIASGITPNFAIGALIVTVD